MTGVLLVLTLLSSPGSFVVVQSVVEGNFPALELYGDQLTESIKTDPFLYFSFIDNYLCSGQKIDKTHCSCHESCTKRASCCIDFFWHDRISWSSVDEYIEYYLDKQSKEISCRTIIEPERIGVPVENIDHAYVVKDCSKWNKLRLSYEYMPVIGSDKVVYLNPTIAECHGTEEFTPLSVNIACNSSMASGTEGTTPVASADCRYKVLDQLSVPKCSPKNICQKTGRSDKSHNAELCSRYSGKILINGKLFNNLHCSRCTRLSLPYRIEIPGANAYEVTVPMPYSVTISYDKNGMEAVYDNQGNKVDIDYKCKAKEIFDINRRKCLPFLCGQGYESLGMKCVKEKPKNTTNPIKEQDNTIDSVLACIFASQNGASVYVNVSRENTFETNQKAELLSSTKSYNLYQVSVDSAEEVQQFISDLKQNKTEIVGGSMILSIASPSVDTRLYGLQLEKAFPQHNFCHQPRVLSNLSNATITSKCQLNVSGVLTPPSDYLPHVKLLLHGSKVMPFQIYTCDVFHLNSNCPRIDIPLPKDSDYKVSSNGTVALLNTNAVYNVSQYAPSRDGISICIKNYVTESQSVKPIADWIQQATVAQSYLTLIGCVISIPCYLFIIIVYARAKELRSVPGKNIICVCLSLLASDILILLTTFFECSEHKKASFVIAALLHYCLLSAHTWTGIISFEIWLTFRQGASSRFAKSTRRFVWYCVTGFLAPFVIVLTLALLDNFAISEINYGRNLCWIESFHYRILVYLIPIAAISLYDCVILSYILAQIYLQRRQSAMLLKKTTEQKETTVLKTAVKLVLLLGLVELIGFVQLPTDQETWKAVLHVFFQFAFVTFRGFRGLFIWVLYVYMNERAWKHKACRENNSYSPKGSPLTTFTGKSYSISAKSSYKVTQTLIGNNNICLLYTSPSPRDS